EMFHKVPSLCDDQNEDQCQPTILAIDLGCFEEEQWQPDKHDEEGNLPEDEAEPKGRNDDDGDQADQQDSSKRNGVKRQDFLYNCMLINCLPVSWLMV